jgi:aspartyl-tRNA(Asn)/glutamyl-tRNA(Gln) amidotransferase subunit C
MSKKFQIDIQKISKLANLPITKQEENLYEAQLSKILGYVESIEKAQTTNIEPTFNVTTSTNVTRNDNISSSLTQEQAIKGAPNIDNGSIFTSGVFEDE